ncbi:MAG: hypothetical protein RJB10_864 [Pseudomonadota bacterium]|jgi:hypothetical protein
MLKLITIISVTTVVFTTSAFAKCEVGGKTIFACTTVNGKYIEVCDLGKSITYTFGRVGKKPEISLNVLRNKVTNIPWSGMGRGMVSTVQIPNANTVYEVFFNVNKQLKENEESRSNMGVEVYVNNKYISTINCKANSKSYFLEDLNLPN